jgi:branched-chain amino acid transport system substrate-binding protein
MKITVIKFFVLAFIISLIGCNNSNKEKVINVGVVIPLTGELGSYGEPMKVGMELAMEELNSRKSGGEQKFNLIFIDSKADQTTAVSGIQKLINIDKVKYVIGDVSSSTTLAMIPIVEQNNIFLFSPGASSPKLIGISKNFARNYPSSVEESIASADFIYNKLSIKESALIYVNNEYGLGLSEMFEKRFKELGGNIMMKEGYAFEQSDFRTLIAKIKSANPPVIYLAGNQKEMGVFMKQFGEYGLTSKIVSNISFLEPDCLNVAGANADGVIVPLPYYNPEDSTMNGAFKFGEIYKRKYGNSPSVAVAVGYDALMILSRAIETQGVDPMLVSTYIRNLKNYDGAMGTLNFTEGDVSIPVVFKKVEDGKPVDYK